MKGYISVPASLYYRHCRYCGSAPVIALADKGLYVVKCPGDDTHYRTQPGIIDIEDWNLNNAMPLPAEGDPSLQLSV